MSFEANNTLVLNSIPCTCERTRAEEEDRLWKDSGLDPTKDRKTFSNLETRKSKILENIEAAEKHREESEQKIKEYDRIVQDSKIEAKNYFNQAQKKILKDINLKKENLDKELNEEIKKTEIEIKDLKNKAPEKINKIAIEISTDLIQQLIGSEVNNSSISAIVNDLSKKDKDKYYGN